MSALAAPAILSTAHTMTLSVEIPCSGCYVREHLVAESLTALTLHVEALERAGWDLRGPLFLCPACRRGRLGQDLDRLIAGGANVVKAYGELTASLDAAAAGLRNLKRSLDAGVVPTPWYTRLWRSVRRALGAGE